MATDFSVRWDLLDQINDMADKLIELLDDQYPYLIVFVVKNENYKTEYKTFYLQAPEIGKKLQTDKFTKIFQLHNIPFDGTPAEEDTWKMPATLFAEVDDIINKMRYKCKNARIPFFAMVAKDSSPKDTNYLMSLASPFECMVKLYDDKITKVLRYTLNPNNYPGQNKELPNDIDQFDEMTQDLIIDSDALNMTVDQYDELFVKDEEAPENTEPQTTAESEQPEESAPPAESEEDNSKSKAPRKPRKPRKKKETFSIEVVEITVENVDEIFPDNLEIQ